jgi:hypothetical protein
MNGRRSSGETGRKRRPGGNLGRRAPGHNSDPGCDEAVAGAASGQRFVRGVGENSRWMVGAVRVAGSSEPCGSPLSFRWRCWLARSHLRIWRPGCSPPPRRLIEPPAGAGPAYAPWPVRHQLQSLRGRDVHTLDLSNLRAERRRLTPRSPRAASTPTGTPSSATSTPRSSSIWRPERGWSAWTPRRSSGVSDVDDLADDGIELCDLGCALHVWTRARVTSHGVEVGGATPLRVVHYPGAISAAVDIGRNEAGKFGMTASVASTRRSTSSY